MRRTPLLILLLATSALAQERPPSDPAPPADDGQGLTAPAAPELDQLTGLVGRWRCKGKVNPSPLGLAHDTRATWRIERDPDAAFYTARYEGKRSRRDPLPLSTSDLIGWDAGERRFVRTAVDNNGGWWDLHAPGWTDDALVFTGEMHVNGLRIPVRHTINRAGDRELRATLEIALPEATDAKPDPKRDAKAWLVLSEETCKR